MIWPLQEGRPILMHERGGRPRCSRATNFMKPRHHALSDTCFGSICACPAGSAALLDPKSAGSVSMRMDLPMHDCTREIAEIVVVAHLTSPDVAMRCVQYEMKTRICVMSCDSNSSPAQEPQPGRLAPHRYLYSQEASCRVPTLCPCHDMLQPVRIRSIAMGNMLSSSEAHSITCPMP